MVNLENILSVRNACIILKSRAVPSTNIARNINALPHSLNIITEKSSDGEMLRNLRMAVTPSYGYGSNTYETGAKCSCSSNLAGDPKRLETCQDIRAEILEKWNKRPRLDIQKHWMKNKMFN